MNQSQKEIMEINGVRIAETPDGLVLDVIPKIGSKGFARAQKTLLSLNKKLREEYILTDTQTKRLHSSGREVKEEVTFIRVEVGETEKAKEVIFH